MDLLMSRTDQKTDGDQPLEVARLRFADAMLLTMGYDHIQRSHDSQKVTANAQPSSPLFPGVNGKPTGAELRASVRYPVWRALVSYWGDYLTTIDIEGNENASTLTA